MNRIGLSVFVAFILLAVTVRFFLARKSGWSGIYGRSGRVRAEVKLIAFAAAFLSVALVFSGYAKVMKGTGSEYLFIYDISPSQNVADCPGEGGKMLSRLECAKAATREAIKKMPPHSSVALGALASNGFEIFLSPTPVTRLGAIEDRLALISTFNAWDSGAEIRLLRMFLWKTIGSWRKPLTIIIFLDGDTKPVEENTGKETVQFFDKGVWMVFVGVGKEIPSIVPGIGKDGKLSGGCFMNYDVGCYTSGLNEQVLKESAVAMKGNYYNLIKDRDGFVSALIQKAPAKTEPVTYEVSLTWQIALAAILFLLVWIVL